MKFIATIASMLTVLFLFWLGGFDFDQRGAVMVGAFICALYVGSFVYFFPGWKE